MCSSWALVNDVLCYYFSSSCVVLLSTSCICVQPRADGHSRGGRSHLMSCFRGRLSVCYGVVFARVLRQGVCPLGCQPFAGSSRHQPWAGHGQCPSLVGSVCRAACRRILWFVCAVAGPMKPSAANRRLCEKELLCVLLHAGFCKSKVSSALCAISQSL